jgi:hypothetical protein
MVETQQFKLNEAQSQKLTDWENEPSILDLKTDLENAKPSQQIQTAKIDRWNNLLQVKGEAAPKKIKGRSAVQPKLIRRQAEWRYSALSEPFLGTPKLFKVSPVTFEDGNASKQNEKVLNYQFRTKLNRVKFIDEFVRATVDEGTSIIRTGWKRHSIPVKEMVPEYQMVEIQDEEQAEAFKQALELASSNPREFNETVSPELREAVNYYKESGTPTVAIQIGEKEITTQKILENFPTAEVMNPKNVFIDPSCGGDMSKAMFVIVSFETSKADLVKEGKRYKNLDRVNWETSTPLSMPDHETKTPNDFNMKGTRKKVVALEYWGFYNINGGDDLVPFVATWIGDTIIRMELNPFPDQKLPFVVIPYLPVKREVYGETDAELLEDNQKILGAITRGMIDVMGRSANGQQGFAKGMLDPLNRRRYEDGKDYEFNPNMPIQQGLIEHKYPELPNSAFSMLGLQNQEAEALTGVKSFSGGMSGESYGDVAAGIRGVLDAASKREMAILRRLAKGMAEVGQKIAAMNAAFLSEEETIRITNTEFETVKREDLEGNFDFEVDISTAEADSAKSQDLGFMLQTMGPSMDTNMTMMILSEIAELKRMPELAQRIRTFQPPVDPLNEERKKLEIEELRLKVAKLQSEVELNDAKAAEARAKAEQADLDYVEQETGTKHERDLEKQQGQAEGNKELAVTKAFLGKLKPDETGPDVESAIGYNELTKPKRRTGESNSVEPVDFEPIPDELVPVDPEMVGPDPSMMEPEFNPGI